MKPKSSNLMYHYLKNDVDEALLTYVLDNVHSVLFVTLQQFCLNAGITEEQAQDFFKAFGANSFVVFKKLLRKSLYYEMTDDGPKRRPLESLAENILSMELFNLTEFASTYDGAAIKRLADDLLEASDVIVLGGRGYGRSIGLFASYLSIMLRHIGVRILPLLANNDNDDGYLSSLNESALVICFGFPRYNKDVLLQLKALKEQGVRIVSITDENNSPYVYIGDYSLILPAHSFDFTDSFTAVTSFINILSVYIGMQLEDTFFQRLSANDAAAEEKNIYFNSFN